MNLQCLFFEGLDVQGVLHRLRLGQVIVQEQLDIVDTGDNVSAGIAVRINGKLNIRPVGVHPHQRLLQVTLLGRRFGYRLEFRHVVVEAEIDNLKFPIAIVLLPTNFNHI